MVAGAGASALRAPGAGPGSRLPDVPHERAGVGLARHTFADQLTGRRGQRRDAGRRDPGHLRAGEQRRHARARRCRSGEIVVRWTVLADVLHLEITDGGAATRPQRRRGPPVQRSAAAAWTSCAAICTRLGRDRGRAVGHRVGRGAHRRNGDD